MVSLTEPSASAKDARIEDLESLVRFERDKFTQEQEKTAKELADLAQRIAAVKEHNQQLTTENKALIGRVGELTRPGAGFRRVVRGLRNRLKKALGRSATPGAKRP
jgi:hypothetical protein